MVNDDLPTLIADAKQRGQHSYASLAKACGGVPSVQRLQQIVTSGIKTFPDPQTVMGLSRGCNVTPEVVVLAAARSLGIDVRTNDPDQVAIPGFRTLPVHLQDTIRTLGRQVADLAQSEQEDNDDRQGDTQQGPEARSTVDGSEDRRKDGSTARGRQTPMSELEKRRQQRRQDEIDGLNFGTKHKPGDLDEPKPLPERFAAKETGTAWKDNVDDRGRGEETQDPGGDA